MANYSNLKAAINAVIKQNGQGEITGEVMNQVLTAMVNSLGSNYMFAGVAIPSTNPGTPDQNVFYMATQAGTYTNFNAIVLQAGISILLWNGSWSSETFYTIDSVPTSGSNNFISSGAVFDKFKLDGGAYDVSAHNNNQTFASLSALLNDANLSTLIPTNIRNGGMSIKFIQTSDNKYVQYRYMGTDITGTPNPFIDTTNWQGVDKELTPGSHNLTESGAILASISAVQEQIGEFIVPYIIEFDNSMINTAGAKLSNSGTDGMCISEEIQLYVNDVLKVKSSGSGFSILARKNTGTGNPYVNMHTYTSEESGQYYEYTALSEIKVVCCGRKEDLSILITRAKNSLTKIDSKIGYYVCNTLAATAKKAITAPGYVLDIGGSIKIKMTLKNTVASGVTLQIGNNTDKPLYYDGAAVSAENTWEAGETVEVYYDGTNYYANNVQGGGTFASGQKVKNTNIGNSADDFPLNTDKLPTIGAILGYTDNIPTVNSDKFVKSGAVANSIEGVKSELGEYEFAYDIEYDGSMIGTSGLRLTNSATTLFCISEEIQLYTNDVLKVKSDSYGFCILGRKNTETGNPYVVMHNQTQEEEGTYYTFTALSSQKVVVCGRKASLSVLLTRATTITSRLSDVETILKDSGYVFKGIAYFGTNASTYKYNAYYICYLPGTYTNFNFTLKKGQIGILLYNHTTNTWTAQAIICNTLSMCTPENLYVLNGTKVEIFRSNLALMFAPDTKEMLIEKGENANYGVNRDYKYVYDVDGTHPDFTLTFGINGDDVGLLQDSPTTIKHVVKASSPATNKNILLIGDSFTAGGYYPNELRRLLTGQVEADFCDASGAVSADSLTNLTFIGTRQNADHPNSCRHEGYAGKSYGYFIESTSPFWNPNTNQIDFSYYCSQNGYSGIDIAVIILGTNGQYVSSYVYPLWDALIAFNPNIKIIIGGRTYACHYGPGYLGGGLSANQSFSSLSQYVRTVNKNYESWCKLDAYKNNCIYVDYNIQIDGLNNMAYIEAQANKRNPNVQVRFTDDSVHPNKYGYWQIADAIRPAIHKALNDLSI